MSEAEWTQREAGSDITTMRRRVRLYREWSRYEAARRQAGDTGQTGLYYALSFVATSDRCVNGKGIVAGIPLSVRTSYRKPSPPSWICRASNLSPERRSRS